VTAILYVLKEGVTWRALDVPGVAWQTVYGYFRRWSRNGLLAEVCTNLNWPKGDRDRAIDSTCIKVHKDGANPAGGQASQALGRTKGGLNTKIHAAVDGKGRPVSIALTPGQAGDSPQAIDLLRDAGRWRLVMMDKAYDSDEIRAYIASQGGEACIPPRSNRKTGINYDRETYKRRSVVENFFEKIKRYRRIGTRYDKLDETFFAFVMLAITTLYLRKQF
jgi:transposase